MLIRWLFRFQFHKGTIKTQNTDQLLTVHIINFNSIKVRLKQNFNLDDKFGVSLFQFHKGTIKTFVSDVFW